MYTISYNFKNSTYNYNSHYIHKEGSKQITYIIALRLASILKFQNANLTNTCINSCL